jgi:predicted O-methyltransferase YrrM
MPLERLPSTGFELSLIATQYRATELASFFYELNCSVSMLHADVLALLYHFGRYGTAPLLELGPFTGGATIAMAKGVAAAASGHKVVSVEVGGASDHVTYATPDIVASFRANLAQRELTTHTQLVVGYSRDDSVVAEVASIAGGQRFGCLLIDSDGHVRDDIERYGPLLLPRAYLVVDDYYSPGAPEKEVFTRKELDALAESGVVEPWGVHGWGTWFGRVA